VRVFRTARRVVVAILPFLAGAALSSLIVVAGIIGYKVLTDWQNFTAIAQSNNEILQAEQAQLGERQAQLDKLEERIAAMLDQHDRNDHERHISGHPRTPSPTTVPIRPPERTATATTRPSTTATTRRSTPTTARPAPAPAPTTTSCERLPNGKCKNK
jgi:hypothetical protein